MDGVDEMTTSTIEFPASVYKVQTLADGGLRLTLDLPEQSIPQAAMLMECKRIGIALWLTAIATDKINIQESNGKPELEARSKRKSEWKAAESTGTN